MICRVVYWYWYGTWGVYQVKVRVCRVVYWYWYGNWGVYQVLLGARFPWLPHVCDGSKRRTCATEVNYP